MTVAVATYEVSCCRTGLIVYYECFSHELLLIPSGQTHTTTYRVL